MRSETPMRLPNEKAGFAPEADLRTVMIRRPDNRAPTDDAKRAVTRLELPQGLFFIKGRATAEGFRPAYWSYGKAPDIEAGEACAAVEVLPADVPRGDEGLDATAIQQAQTDEARSSRASPNR